MMKKLLFLFFFLCSTHLFAQEFEGELINDKGETKTTYFVRPYGNKNFHSIIFLHYGMEQELYAKYHRRARFSDQIVYVSILPAGEEERGWSQLQFESDDIRLYLRYKKYYIEINEQVYNISRSQNPDELNLPEDLQKRWKDAMGDTRGLSFKKVKKLLVRYHEEEGLNYATYFDVPEALPEIEVGVSMCMNKGSFLINSVPEIDSKSLSPALFANVRFFFPRILKKSYVSGGIMLERNSFQKDEEIKGKGFYEMDLSFYQLSFPISFNLRLKEMNGFKFYAKVGTRTYFNLQGKDELIAERSTNGVVRTEEAKITLANDFGIAPVLGLVADKKIGKREMSFSFLYEKYGQSGSASETDAEFEMSNPTIRLSASLKF